MQKNQWQAEIFFFLNHSHKKMVACHENLISKLPITLKKQNSLKIQQTSVHRNKMYTVYAFLIMVLHLHSKFDALMPFYLWSLKMAVWASFATDHTSKGPAKRQSLTTPSSILKTDESFHFSGIKGRAFVYNSFKTFRFNRNNLC